MYVIKNCCIVVLILMLTSCKKHTHFTLIYSKNLYEPEVFDSSCEKLFDYDVNFVELDTSYYRALKIRNPIYNSCLENKEFISFFSSKQNGRIPFYNGNVKASPNLTLFSFNKLLGDNILESEGYMSITQKGGAHLTFKAFELGTIEGESFKSFYEKGHIIMIREVDPLYDLIDSSKKKEVVIYFCVLKTDSSGKIRVLTSQAANEMVTAEFFHSLSYKNN